VQKKGRVLVVEGDDLIRELLERWLREGGYAVAFGDLETLRQDGTGEAEPLVVILDLGNPRSATGAIRSVRAAYSAPILAISGRFRRGLSNSRDAARRLGASKVLAKPFSADELLAAVREAIEDPA
jgi:DNA-binding response OmpR family regulator